MNDDERLLGEFEACTIPASKWGHREHIKVAYLYLSRYPYEESLARFRRGVKALNTAHKVEESLTRGYHETITQAWLRLVAFATKSFGAAESADAFFEDHPELWQSKTLRLFYSRERLMSAQAKAEFVEPDLTAFPSV